MSKLSISKETIVRLDPDGLDPVVGGTGGTVYTCVRGTCGCPSPQTVYTCVRGTCGCPSPGTVYTCPRGTCR